MAKLPKKAIERIAAGIKRFQPILQAAKGRDVNESDTVVIVTDVLQYVFGYDKYAEITSEHMIRSTFCDLAVKLDGCCRSSLKWGLQEIVACTATGTHVPTVALLTRRKARTPHKADFAVADTCVHRRNTSLGVTCANARERINEL